MNGSHGPNINHNAVAFQMVMRRAGPSSNYGPPQNQPQQQVVTHQYEYETQAYPSVGYHYEYEPVQSSQPLSMHDGSHSQHGPMQTATHIQHGSPPPLQYASSVGSMGAPSYAAQPAQSPTGGYYQTVGYSQQHGTQVASSMPVNAYNPPQNGSNAAVQQSGGNPLLTPVSPRSFASPRAQVWTAPSSPWNTQNVVTPWTTTPAARRPPPANYICHRCRIPGHWIEECPQKQSKNNVGKHQQTSQQHFQQPMRQPQLQQFSPFPQQPVMHQNVHQGMGMVPGQPLQIQGQGQNLAFHDSTTPQQQTVLAPEAAPSGTHAESRFICEPCSKHFTIESQYKAHLETHEMCRHPGCTFSGTKKVVSAHWHGTHGQYAGQGMKTIDVDGMKFQVLVGNSPEDIRKWREERRKNWPSIKNMERKKHEQTKRVNAGGLLDEAPSTGRKRQRDSSGAPIGSVSKQARTEHSPNKQKESGETMVNEPSSNPLGLLAAAYSSSDNEDEPANSSVEMSEISPVANKSNARQRPCKYMMKGKCTKGADCLFSHDVKVRHCQYFLNGRCSKGSRCLYAHDPEERKRHKQDKANNKTANNNESGAGNKSGAKTGSRPNLLEKLLAKDIRRETSYVLQMIRFIVQNDFFEAPRNTLDTAEQTPVSSSQAAET